MNYVWGHAERPDPAQWIGAFTTREEAVSDEATRHYTGAFWVQKGRMYGTGEFVPSPDDIVEIMATAAYDNAGGGITDDWPYVDDGGKDVLASLLAWWSDTYVSAPTFWEAVGDPERVRPGGNHAD